MCKALGAFNMAFPCGFHFQIKKKKKKDISVRVVQLDWLENHIFLESVALFQRETKTFISSCLSTPVVQ